MSVMVVVKMMFTCNCSDHELIITLEFVYERYSSHNYVMVGAPINHVIEPHLLSNILGSVHVYCSSTNLTQTEAS